MSSWLRGWFDYLLDFFDLARKRAKIIFIGLDNAGKTTLMGVLKNDTISAHAPTHHATSEEFSIGGVKMTVFDLGGHIQVWKEYIPSVDAVVFLADCADLGRLEEAKRELLGVLNEDLLAQCPILILGNKIDRDGAIGESILKDFLGVHRFCTGKDPEVPYPDGVRPLEVFMCSVVQRVEFGQAFRWLSKHLDGKCC